MTQHDDLKRLQDMLDYAQEAVEFAAGRQRQDLETDRPFRFALTHMVEIVGEAAAHVPEPLRATHTGIPWTDIVALRNRLIHGYSDVDLDILWDILRIDLPPLIAELRKILGQGG